MLINRTAIAGVGVAGLLLAALSVASPATAATATETELTADTPTIVLADGVSKSGTVNLDAKSSAIGGGADVTVSGATYVFRRNGGTIPSNGATASVTSLGCGAHTFSATLSAVGYESSVGTATVEVTGSACGTPPVEPVEPKPSDTDKPGDVYYASCWDVKAAGKAPINPGQPGFRAELDWDHNGIGCDEGDDAQPKPKPEPEPTATVTATATATTTATATVTPTATPTTAPAACTNCGAECGVDCSINCGASCTTGCGRCGARASRIVTTVAPDVIVETTQTQPAVVYGYVVSGTTSTDSSTGAKTTTGTPAFTG
jgi:hypothetical protein